ncbi:MAG: SAM-dependent DNA methyltransferase [Fibrobacter sp.]|nr:SAM-dependent DNA methyltransferase [Fibrobacter sp.]
MQKYFVLTPERYVGAVEQEEYRELFIEEITSLTELLKEQLDESDRLESEIKKNLAGLGYGF